MKIYPSSVLAVAMAMSIYWLVGRQVKCLNNYWMNYEEILYRQSQCFCKVNVVPSIISQDLFIAGINMHLG